MAFKLTKDETGQRQELSRKLSEAAAKLSGAIDAFNAGLEQLKAPVEAAADEYNSLISDAREFAENIASQADADIGDKSDRWTESDRGQAAVQWRDEWQGISMDDVDVQYPDDIDPPDLDHSDNLEAMPECAE